MHPKHKKAFKRKHVVARKRRQEFLNQASPAVRAAQYYQHICRVIKHYGKETEEYKKLLQMKTAYEEFQKKKSAEKKDKAPKILKPYRVVQFTEKLDKVEIKIKECQDSKELEKLKIRKALLKTKLNLK